MVSTFIALLRLQTLDRDALIIQKEIKSLQKAQDDQGAELTNIERELNQLETEINHCQRLEAQQKEELGDSTEKIKKWEKRMFEIKNTREQQALQREIDGLKQQHEVLTGQDKEIRDRLEELKGHFDSSKEEYDQKLEKHNNIRTESDSQIETMNKRLKKLDKEMDKYRGEVPKQLLSKYTRIITRREGLAISEAKDRKCNACYRMITPQVWNEMHKKLDLVQCSSCQRFIYIKDVLIKDAEKADIPIPADLFK